MALKRLRYILTLMAFLAAAFAQPVAVVRAAGAKVTDRPLPSLATFAQTLTNGEKHALRGVYVPGILAHKVVQQPAGDPGFVSSDRDLLTQFQQRRSSDRRACWRTILWPARSPWRMLSRLVAGIDGLPAISIQLYFLEGADSAAVAESFANFWGHAVETRTLRSRT